ncbi:MAG: hypothetical protein LBT46_03140 [Planctomycetaceae bacterium]|jgi:hypothetical protein|nr:hypothetical protein [Planctomycetaceae bacterium]
MRTITAVTACFIAACFATASAQKPTAEQSPQQIQKEIEQQFRFNRTPKRALSMQADAMFTDLSPWNGQGTWMPLRLALRFGGESGLALTDEQKQRLSFLYKESEIGNDFFLRMRQNPTPEFTELQNAVGATEIPGDPFFERATEEQKNAYREASANILGLFSSDMQREIHETLTPEQMLQVRKLEMQIMPEFGIPFPSMFEPLGLTDEQKKEMEKITAGMKEEYVRLVTENAALKSERIQDIYKTLEEEYKKTPFASREEFNKKRNEAFQKYKPDETLKKKYRDSTERGIKLVTLLKTRLMNVLTDEQLDKMQKIMDETPEYAKKLLAMVQKKREMELKSGDYVPGPDSWRPGDGTPKDFKDERKLKTFPKAEQQK